MKDGKKAAIAVGLVGGIGTLVYLATRAKAIPPPEEYVCPYCAAAFNTYEELVAHVQSVHPGERLPIDIIWTD